MEGSKSRVCLAYPTSHVDMLQHTQHTRQCRLWTYAFFQDFPGLETGNLNILISRLSSVCTKPENATYEHHMHTHTHAQQH